jgi:hypothetical protein
LDKEHWLKLVGFFTILGATAALLVVPEIRTFLGLPNASSQQSSNKAMSSSVTVRAYNIDDLAMVYVNGTQVLRITYGNSSQKDITNQLRPGKNDIRFVLENSEIGFTYGFEIYQHNQSIFKQECGEVGGV